MNLEEFDQLRIHHGHNVRRLRKEKNMSQEAMAEKACVAQQTVSRYEATREIDDEMLVRFAKALDVPVEVLKTMEEDSNYNFYIENNTFSDGSHVSPFGSIQDPIYNPVKEIIDLCNEKTVLYERMINLEREKIAMLEKLLNEKK